MGRERLGGHGLWATGRRTLLNSALPHYYIGPAYGGGGWEPGQEVASWCLPDSPLLPQVQFRSFVFALFLWVSFNLLFYFIPFHSSQD